jgi:hypothetical protein
MKMAEAQREAMRSRYEAIRWMLNERMHRLWAAPEAKGLGMEACPLSEITGTSRIVIQRGIKELEDQAFPDPETGAGGSDDPDPIPSL